MTDYDHPWKEALDVLFESFVEFCVPDLYARVDWTTPVKMLDKEFQQIAPVSEIGARSVDKLVEVRLVSGDFEWLLIHVEVQSQPVADFARRMFTYFYRIVDKYNKRVMSLAVLGDLDPNWRPSGYRLDTFDCSMEFKFPVVKLLDFESRQEELEQSANPFAVVIMAHLMAQRSAGRPNDRLQYKAQLIRQLYQRGWDAERIRGAFRLIDWMMDLPRDIEIKFRQELERIEEEHQVAYLTSIERLAREEGLKEGLGQGIEKGIATGLDQGLEIGGERGIYAGKIQLLEQMLGEPETASDALLGQDVETL
ncbi:MAG: hypothetical protein KDA47_01210, partial [Planctomycetales bacterium]|nr:hypothetical protein [Planctomycetales bacterium]